MVSMWNTTSPLQCASPHIHAEHYWVRKLLGRNDGIIEERLWCYGRTTTDG